MNYTVHTQIIDIYFNEIKKNQSLTLEDEKVLFARIARGDEMAKNEIYNRMAKMAVTEAKKFTNNPDVLCDLIQEANIGILAAIDKFDITKGYRFSSYARWWMKAMMIDCLEMMNLIQRKNTALENKIRKIHNEFLQNMGRMPSEYEVLDILEGMGEKVNDLSLLHTLCISSVDEHFEDSDEDMEATGGMSMKLSVDNDYEDEIENESLIDILERKMRCLSEREKRLVSLKFGIGQDYEMDYDAIAVREGLTSERVRQIVTGAIKKMK